MPMKTIFKLHQDIRVWVLSPLMNSYLILLSHLLALHVILLIYKIEITIFFLPKNFMNFKYYNKKCNTSLAYHKNYTMIEYD